MKNYMKKFFCMTLAVACICMTPQIAKAGEPATDLAKKADQVVLTVGVGMEKGKLGYSDTMEGGGSGPETFTVAEDGTIYIADNVNKRVNVYKDGAFIYDIETPYIVYIRSMVVSQNLVYLMDYDAGKIYALDAQGSLVKNIALPENMESYLMEKLYVQDDGTVCLYYENNMIDESSKGVLCSYPVDQLAKGRSIGAKGFSKNDENTCSISQKSLCFTVTDVSRAKGSSVGSFTQSVQVADPDSLTAIKILNVDDGNAVYLDVFEMVDSSIVAGEYTVKQYVDGTCENIAAIDLESYYFMPNNVLFISDQGDLYQMICYTDKVEIIKKHLSPVNCFNRILRR